MSGEEAKLVETMRTQIEGLKSIESVRALQEALRTVGKEIRIRDGPARDENKTPGETVTVENKIYVVGLSPDATLEQVEEHFKAAGAIANTRFTYKGFKMRKASIEYEKQASVQAAITQFNLQKFQDFELTVSEFVLKERAERPERPERKPRAAKEGEVRPRKAAAAPRSTEPRRGDRAERGSKVAPARAEQAPRKAAAPKREVRDAQDGGVYVGNLAYAVDDKIFADFVYGFGKTKEQYIQRDSRGRSKGYGIVIFRSAADAEKCITELNGLELEGRKVFARPDKGDTTETTFTEKEPRATESTRGGARGRGERGGRRGSD